MKGQETMTIKTIDQLIARARARREQNIRDLPAVALQELRRLEKLLSVPLAALAEEAGEPRVRFDNDRTIYDAPRGCVAWKLIGKIWIEVIVRDRTAVWVGPYTVRETDNSVELLRNIEALVAAEAERETT